MHGIQFASDRLVALTVGAGLGVVIALLPQLLLGVPGS